MLRDSTAATGLLHGQRGEQQADRTRTALHYLRSEQLCCRHREHRSSTDHGLKLSYVIWSSIQLQLPPTASQGKEPNPRFGLVKEGAAESSPAFGFLQEKLP